MFCRVGRSEATSHRHCHGLLPKGETSESTGRQGGRGRGLGSRQASLDSVSSVRTLLGATVMTAAARHRGMWFDEGDREVFGSFESVRGDTATAAYDGQLRLSARRGVRTREGRDRRNS